MAFIAREVPQSSPRGRAQTGLTSQNAAFLQRLRRQPLVSMLPTDRLFRRPMRAGEDRSSGPDNRCRTGRG
jgi:hypothetical protein